MSDEIQQPEQSRQIARNAEIDQEWADWLAPTRRSLLYGAGAAAVGLVLGAGRSWHSEVCSRGKFSVDDLSCRSHRVPPRAAGKAWQPDIGAPA
jgi:hypothetical protein